MGEMLRFRHNVMNVSAISGFANVKGGINNNCKDIYFVRAIGANTTYLNEIKKMDDTLLTAMNAGRGYYYRVNELSKMPTMEEVEFYSQSYSNWIEGGKKEMLSKVTKTNKILSQMLSEACSAVWEIYGRISGQITDSMVKNLIVKLLFWYDSIFSDKKYVWDEKKSSKIVAANIHKKQEYLFFYLLTLMGCDVLLLQSGKDINEELENLNLSTKFVLGNQTEIAIPKYEWHDTKVPVKDVAKENPPKQEASKQEQSKQYPQKENNNQANQESPVRIHIPQHERAGKSGGGNNPAGGNDAISGNVAINGNPAVNGSGDAEKSLEELAQLASSVVLIKIHDATGKIIGSGSGIMIGRDGYILTNNHVACGGKYYTVRMEDDDKEYQTDEVIKYNHLQDLAIIRIERTLNPIPVYKGTKGLVRGQKVVAIGSPLGLFNSVSDGIISGFRKFDFVDMIQFTAPISHGSSGGALLNMQGEVIGISTAGFDDGQNINLAMGYECINTFIKGFV